MSNRKIKTMLLIPLLFVWAFHIWMAHEKGDWYNLWRWSQMGLEFFCSGLAALWLIECSKNEKLLEELKKK